MVVAILDEEFATPGGIVAHTGSRLHFVTPEQAANRVDVLSRTEGWDQRRIQETLRDTRQGHAESRGADHGDRTPLKPAVVLSDFDDPRRRGEPGFGDVVMVDVSGGATWTGFQRLAMRMGSAQEGTLCVSQDGSKAIRIFQGTRVMIMTDDAVDYAIGGQP